MLPPSRRLQRLSITPIGLAIILLAHLCFLQVGAMPLRVHKELEASTDLFSKRHPNKPASATVTTTSSRPPSTNQHNLEQEQTLKASTTNDGTYFNRLRQEHALRASMLPFLRHYSLHDHGHMPADLFHPSASLFHSRLLSFQPLVRLRGPRAIPIRHSSPTVSHTAYMHSVALKAKARTMLRRTELSSSIVSANTSQNGVDNLLVAVGIGHSKAASLADYNRKKTVSVLSRALLRVTKKPTFPWLPEAKPFTRTAKNDDSNDEYDREIVRFVNELVAHLKDLETNYSYKNKNTDNEARVVALSSPLFAQTDRYKTSFKKQTSLNIYT